MDTRRTSIPLVTTELAQELAETGAVQLPLHILGENLPSNSKAQLRSGSIETKVDFSEYCISDQAGQLGGIVRQIFAMACEPLPTVARTMEWATHQGYAWHLDPETSKGGISILMTSLMRGPVRSNETLEIGGRGRICSSDSFELHYADGPIVIAQQNFGELLLTGDEPTGGTWHMSRRNTGARFRVIDFW